jgi:hypothetical protein
VAGRESVFSNDDIINSLNADFIPVVDNVSSSQRRKDDHGEFFRLIAEQGHYRGRSVPTNTRQGLYAATAGGQLLVSVNSTSAGRVQRLLSDAKRIWSKTTAKERSPKLAEPGEPDRYFTRKPPVDGLALRSTVRDLPRPKGQKVDLSPSNLDHVWIDRDDMLSLIPSELVVGKSANFPDKIAQRIARYHLLDSVRGEAEPFAEEYIQQADIKLIVAKVDDGRIKFKVAGRCRANRPPNKNRNPYTGKTIPTKTGYDLQLYGIAEFDRQKEQFVRFDLLAAGDRWGGTMYNFRDNDLGKSPIGFAFELVEDVAKNPTPPRFHFSY